MTSTIKERGGSFRELRNRHLPLFDDALHRRNRGWPHRSPEPSGENAPKTPVEKRRHLPFPAPRRG